MDFDWIRGPELGRGSFSTVDLAIPTSTSTSGRSPPLMAVKSSNTSKSSSSTLLHEKWVLDQIGTSPHIIQCFGGDEHNLFLEFASGGSLADLMKRFGGKLPEIEVRRNARSILRGLSRIHDMGFVHCDLKIQNVLVVDDGEVKIGDFGLAKRKTEETERFGVRGSPMYMSPESVAGDEQSSPADIWAFGCLVSEMISGKPAWSESNLFSLMVRIGAGVESPEIPINLSENGIDFLEKIFVNDPRKRWTAGELLEHPFVAGEFSGEISGELSPSPRGPLDLREWVSVVGSSGVGLWSEMGLGFAGEDPGSRIGRLESGGSDRGLDWSVSGSWVTVRE